VTDDSPTLAEARHKAELARAKFWSSFDDLIDYAHRLQQKLEPSHLAKDAWDAAKSKGVDLAEDAVDSVRKRPVAAGGAVAALALFIAREPLMDLAGKLMSGDSKKKRKRAPNQPRKPLEKIDE